MARRTTAKVRSKTVTISTTTHSEMRLVNIHTRNGVFLRFAYIEISEDGYMVGCDPLNNVFNEVVDAGNTLLRMQAAIHLPVLDVQELGRRN